MNKTDKNKSHWIVNERSFFDHWEYNINYDSPIPVKSQFPNFLRVPFKINKKKLEDILKKYSNIEQIEQIRLKSSPNDSFDYEYNKVIWDFVNTLKIGDDIIVISTNSVPIILGKGKIKSDYSIKDSRLVRDVEWSLLVDYGRIVFPYLENWFVLRSDIMFNTEVFGSNYYNEILKKIDEHLERFR